MCSRPYILPRFLLSTHHIGHTTIKLPKYAFIISVLMINWHMTVNKNICCVHGSKSILSKYPCYPTICHTTQTTLPTDSMKYLLKFQWLFSQIFFKILQYVQNHKRLQIAKVILRKKNKAGDSTLLDFQLYYKVVVIKTA